MGAWRCGTTLRVRPNAFSLRDRADELFDFAQHRLLIAGEWQMIDARQLDETRTGDVAREITPLLDVHVAVAAAVQHERRRADRRQVLTNVDVRIHLRERHGSAWTRRHAQV